MLGSRRVVALDEHVAACEERADAGHPCVAALDECVAALDQHSDAPHPCIAARDVRADAERPPVAAPDECPAAFVQPSVGFAALWHFTHRGKGNAYAVDEAVHGSFWQ